MQTFDKNLFAISLPAFPEQSATDAFYLRVGERLFEAAMSARPALGFDPRAVQFAVICLTGYYQDVIADAGVWRGFINEMRRLYGRTLPFFDTADDYIDYELNPEDVRFLVWYAIAMTDEAHRDIYPLDRGLGRLASAWYDILEELYEEAPLPENFSMIHELEMNDPEDHKQIMDFAEWLGARSWLMTPSEYQSKSAIYAQVKPDEEGMTRAREMIHELITSQPIGPLALYLTEWVWVMVENRMPPESRKTSFDRENENIYPGYEPFLNDTGGSPVKVFADYDSMNDFLINVLGFSAGERHLQQLEFCEDFILMVNKTKGLLVATDIARCVAMPGNDLYSRNYARRHAFELLSRRGKCPADLLLYICSHGWLPDASFPGSDDTALVTDNYDFIARCYLQLYYRGD